MEYLLSAAALRKLKCQIKDISVLKLCFPYILFPLEIQDSTNFASPTHRGVESALFV